MERALGWELGALGPALLPTLWLSLHFPALSPHKGSAGSKEKLSVICVLR